MTLELTYLLLTAVLTGCLWIPVVVGFVSARGLLQPHDYVQAPTSPLPDWVNRANRAHANAVENFAVFAAIVIVAHLAGVSTGLTQACAAVYFYVRVAHAVIHISGFSHFMARTVIFTVGWAAFLVYALAVLAAG